MGMALFSFSAIAIAGREAGRGLTTNELIFWRSVLGIVVLCVIYLAQPKRRAMGRDGIATAVLPWHIVRGLVHFTAQYSWLYALILIPLTQLFALEFTSPLWVAILAPLFLGERLTGWRIAAAVLGFIGALIVVEPGLLTGQLQMTASIGTAFAAFSALGFASSMILTKRLTRTEPALRILFWMQVLQAIIAAIILGGIGMTTGAWPVSWTAQVPLAQWGWVSVIGIAGLTAHFGLTRAFGLADAIIVAPMDFLRLPLIAVVGALVYGENLSVSVGLGAGIVVAANALNMWAERRASVRKTAALPA